MLPGFLLRGSSPACLPFPLGDRHPVAERVGVHRLLDAVVGDYARKGIIWQTDVASLS